MKQHTISTSANSPTPRRSQPILLPLQQFLPILHKRPRHRFRRGIAHIILRIREAMRRVEEEIRIPFSDQIRCLNKRPITIIPVQNLHRVPVRREPVLLYLLQQDRGGDDGLDAVVAVAAVADAVTVDFEDDVARAVGVEEAGWVDGAALVETAGEGCFAGDVGACGIGGLRDGYADAVVADFLFGFAGVVEDVFSVVLGWVSQSQSIVLLLLLPLRGTE